jgi:hypothetical protein
MDMVATAIEFVSRGIPRKEDLARGGGFHC